MYIIDKKGQKNAFMKILLHEYLKKHHISYINHDLSEHPEKEKDLRKLTGTRIVPAFVWKEKSLKGLLRKPNVLIGFENHVDEIKKILDIK